MPRPICREFERQVAARAFSRAWAKTGNRIAARMAMIAMTTSSSISVKPDWYLLRIAAFSGKVREAVRVSAEQANHVMLTPGHPIIPSAVNTRSYVLRFGTEAAIEKRIRRA